MAEVDDTIKKLAAYPGVQGLLVINVDGIPIKTTMDYDLTVHYASLLNNLHYKAQNVIKELDPQNDIVLLRLHTKKHEIICAPENDFKLILLQSKCPPTK